MKRISKPVWAILILTLILMIGSVLFWKCVYVPRESYAALMSEAQSFSDAGNYAQALERVESALELDAGNENAQKMKAELCGLLKDYQSAYDTYQKLFEETENPEYEASAAVMEKKLQLDEQNYGQAAEYYHEYNVMSGLWNSNGMYSIEFEPYNRYFKYHSADGEVLLDGTAVLTRGETENGRTLYTISDEDANQIFEVSFDPKSDDYLMVNGQVYQRAGDANG